LPIGQDVSGFYIENIARYKEIVKSKREEKREILYQRSVRRKPAKTDAQLSFDFAGGQRLFNFGGEGLPRKPDGQAAEAAPPVEPDEGMRADAAASSAQAANAGASGASPTITKWGYERPIALGDVIVTPFKAYEIDAINERERTLDGAALDGSGERMTVRVDKRGYHIVPRPGEETRRLLSAIGSEAFFDCPDGAGVKEDVYFYADMGRSRFPRFASEPQLRKGLVVVTGEYRGRTLNPYNKSGREEIVKLAGEGATFLKGGAGRDSLSDRETRRAQAAFVKAHFPDVYAAMERAIREEAELFDEPEEALSERARESQGAAAEEAADGRAFAVGAFALAAENTPENFFKNVNAIADGMEGYKDKPVEAARALLRASPGDARAAIAAYLQTPGGASPEEMRGRIQAEYERFKRGGAGLETSGAERAGVQEEPAESAKEPAASAESENGLHLEQAFESAKEPAAVDEGAVEDARKELAEILEAVSAANQEKLREAASLESLAERARQAVAGERGKRFINIGKIRKLERYIDKLDALVAGESPRQEKPGEAGNEAAETQPEAKNAGADAAQAQETRAETENPRAYTEQPEDAPATDAAGQDAAGAELEAESAPIAADTPAAAAAGFRPYGAWTGYGASLTPACSGNCFAMFSSSPASRLSRSARSAATAGLCPSTVSTLCL
jgi:hypothetical protein